MVPVQYRIAITTATPVTESLMRRNLAEALDGKLVNGKVEFKDGLAIISREGPMDKQRRGLTKDESFVEYRHEGELVKAALGNSWTFAHG